MALTTNTGLPLDGETVNEERFGDGSVGSGKTLEQVQDDWLLPETPNDGEIFYGKGRPEPSINNTSVNGTSITVTGNIINGGGYSNIDCDYRYGYRTYDSGNNTDPFTYTSISTVSGAYTGTVSSHTFNNLDTGRRYEIIFELRNIHDNGAWFRITIYPTTEQDDPQNVNLTQSSNSGELTWDHPPSGQPNQYYEVNIGNDTQNIDSSNTSFLSQVCDDEIANGTEGYVSGYVKAHGEWGAESNQISDSHEFTCFTGCLIEGTSVTLKSGKTIPIEDLKASDKLVGITIEGFEDSNKAERIRDWSDGNDLDISKATAIVEKIEPQDIGYTIRLNNGLLQASPEHHQLVKQQGKWKFARLFQVQEGDRILTDEGQEVRVTSKDYVTENKTVYKLTLKEPVHIFVANGILTHNIK